MRIPYLFVFFLFYVIAAPAQKSAGTKMYSQTIIADKINDPDFQLSVADLETYLQKLTGNIFTQRESPRNNNGGIFIKLVQPGLLSQQQYNRLLAGSIEDFFIVADKERLLLTAKHPKGLCHAIYTYLDLLGIKWYFPGSLWEYVPHRDDIRLSLNQSFKPSFTLRSFFGTGAIVPVHSIDPSSELQKRWNDWKRRNRMSGEVQLAGHYGETFNYRYKQVLEQHPEYLAMINGKRVAWAPGTKLCISNPAVQKLYIKDRIEEAENNLRTNNGSEKITVSVEPSDGDGDCECDVCRKMGSVSDRDYYLANEVAKAFEKISPRLYANIYAYNLHAAPPSFSLAPKLIVQIVPYAFQRVSDPTDFIQQWKKKAANLLLYDYYGIPDWNYNLPLSDEYSKAKLKQKIRYWYAQNIKGFTLESSYSIGSTGFGLFAAARMGWDIHSNIDAEENGFYKNMFASSLIVKDFFNKLNDDFNGTPDVSYMQSQLVLANKETKGQFSERIGQWQEFLHYILLYNNMQDASDKQKQNQWEKLIQYVWRIYSTGMLHSTRLAELFIDRFGIPSSVSDKWNPHNEGAQSLQHLTALPDREIKMIVKDDMDRYPLLKDFPYQTKKLNYSLVESGDKKDVPNDGVLTLEFPETFAKAQNGSIEFWIKTNEASADNNSQNIKIDLVDTSSGNIVQFKTLNITKDWVKVRFAVAGSGTYKVAVNNKNWIRLYVAPSQWLGFASVPTHSVLGKLYFQVPAGVSNIYYTNTSTNQPVFKTIGGKILGIQKINEQNLYGVSIPSSSSDQMLTLEESEYKYLKFYSVPGLFFLYPNYTRQ